MLRASAVVIGDEVLGGYVVDANSPLLAERLQGHGVPLDRIHTVPDDVDDIVDVLRQEFARGGPRLLVTSGGIGSTPDDITFESVAAAMERPLVENPLIAERIDRALQWQSDLGMDVTEEYRWHMMRMARLPEGGRLLDAERGWIPGIVIDHVGGCDSGGTSVAILPGVPREFARLLDDVILPGLVAGRNEPPAVAEITHGLPESALNPMFARLGEAHPDVKLGSYPGQIMMIRLTGAASDVAAATTFVRAGLDAILATTGGAALAAAWGARFTSNDD